MARDPEPDAPQDEPRPEKVVLDPQAASELVDLLADQPGTADEALLDAAKDALADRTTKIPGEQQQAIGAGELVALEIDPDEASAALDLIRENVVADRGVVRRLADRLRSRVRRAKDRRGNRGGRGGKQRR